MNAADVVKLLALIRTCSPAFGAEPGTSAVWAELLADIPAADAAAAVKAHFRVTGPWITPADIRRRVVDARGLLPPDPEAAYGQAREFNRWLNRRVGPEPAIHPAALAAAREIRWDTFDGPEGYAHRRFVDAYRPAADKATDRALIERLDVLEGERAAPKALPAGVGVQQPVELRPNPAGVARVETAIVQSGFGKRVPTS